METIQNLLTRRSVRKFLDKPIGRQDIHKLLTAGMSGPSCVNSRPWEFLVLTDRQMLCEMAEANGRPAEPLRHAALGILVCGNLQRAFELAPDYWIIDCAIAAQNMILAANDLGIGSVWLGTWPQQERVARQRQLLDLPEHIIPHSIIAFGYPESSDNELRQPYEQGKVHFETW